MNRRSRDDARFSRATTLPTRMPSSLSTPGMASQSRSVPARPAPPTAWMAPGNSLHGCVVCRPPSERALQTLDLGLIGNCSISALIDQHARIVWCCLPRFDGDPVFHALLGAPSASPDDGVFSIEIENL